MSKKPELDIQLVVTIYDLDIEESDLPILLDSGFVLHEYYTVGSNGVVLNVPSSFSINNNYHTYRELGLSPAFIDILTEAATLKVDYLRVCL